MNKDELKALLIRYEENTCTEEEKALVETSYLRHPIGQLPNPAEIARDLNEIQVALDKTYRLKNHTVKIKRIAIAATFLLIFLAGAYMFLLKPQQQIAKIDNHDISPGSNTAILTLANGQRIVLTSTQNGTVALESHTRIQKIDGRLIYQSNSGNDGNLVYNTMSTPKGGQYELSLSDGTKVTLDASSSITYPVAFNGKERKVSITGQAYFEVAHQTSRPFIINMKGQTIEDIGTQFNVNAYDDEPHVSTTLLEGAIGIRPAAVDKLTLLKPGQQATIAIGDNRIYVAEVNIKEVMAWKNGFFRFKDENIMSIMRKLSRWYNVDIQYEGNIPSDGFNGVVSRYKNISQVLKGLEATNAVHFKITGRTIIVTE